MVQQFPFQTEQPVLILVQAGQVGRSAFGDLPAKLGPDAAGRAGDQHPLAGQQPGQHGQVAGHRAAPEQAVGAEILDPPDAAAGRFP